MTKMNTERVKKRLFTSAYSEGLSWVASPIGLWAASNISVINDPLQNLTERTIGPGFEGYERFMHKWLPTMAPDLSEEEREALPRDEKVKIYSDDLKDYLLYNVAGVLTRVTSQPIFDKRLAKKLEGMPTHQPKIDYWGARGADWGAQIISLGAINTIFKGPADHLRHGLTTVLEKSLRIDEDSADKASRLIINIGVPNLVGYASSNAAMELMALRREARGQSLLAR